MIDKIAKAYKSMVQPILKPKKNDYPILMDGKTFDDEKSERSNDAPEKSLEDVIKQLKETFNVPPKEGIENTLDVHMKTNYLFSDNTPPEAHTLNSVFKDLTKNGVNYDKLNTLTHALHHSSLSNDHKYTLSNIWAHTIKTHFGKDPDNDIEFGKEEPKSKEEMLAHAAKHPNVRMSSMRKGYHEIKNDADMHNMRIPIGFDKHGEPHVMSGMDSGESMHEDNEKSFEANHLADSHKQYFRDLSDEKPKHFDEDVHARIDKVRSLVRYTADYSGPFNRYLIYKHNGNADMVNATMNDNAHKIGPTHEDYEKHIGNISEILHNAPAIEHPISVFSGLSGRSGINAHAEKHRQTSGDNMVFHLPAFTSTSTKFGIGTAFAKDAPIQEDEEKMYGGDVARADVQDVLHIKLPAGFKKGAYVEHISENSGEHEYLLDKGTNVSVHPTPKYLFKGRSLYRIWDAHPHKEEE